MTEQDNTSHISGFNAAVHESMIRNMAHKVNQINKSSLETSNSYIAKIRKALFQAKITIKQKRAHSRMAQLTAVINNSAGC